MMSDSDHSHDEAISQFSSLTGVTPPEVSSGESALLGPHINDACRQEDTLNQASGIWSPPQPNSTPRLRKQPARKNLP